MTRHKLILALMANFFIPLAGISTDIYLPSMPAMSHLFGVSKELTQLTITTFTIGMGIMQFFAGPISDAIGRKKLLVGSLILQIISIIAILMTPSMTVIIFLRFVQGCAAAFLIVPARAILNDSFSGDALKKQFNYTTIAFALGPILGPFIGGYLQHYFGWQANFIFILGYAVLAFLLATLVYRETIPQKRRFSLHHVWENYGIISRNKLFLVSSIFTACLFSATAFFNVAGPFLIQEAMQHSAITFGHMALLIGVAWFLGNLTNRFLFHVSPVIKTVVGLIIEMLAIISLLILSQYGYFNLPTFMVPMFIIIFVNGGIFSLFAAECLTMFPKLAASANAFFFSVNWTSFSLFTVVALSLKSASLSPIAFTLLGVNVFCFLLYSQIKRLGH